MPSLRAISSMPAHASGPIMAEGTTLPRLRAAGFEAHVNAYAVGRTERLLRHSAAAPHGQNASAGTSAQTDSPTHTASAITLSSGSPGCANGVTDLWYLSLVAPRGQGTTLRALWANLVSNRERNVWLEGVGSVALGHHRLDLTTLGYPIHWTYRQAVIPPSRDVQSVLEADALTYYDPLLVPPGTPRQQRTSHQSAHQQRKGAATERAESGALTLSSRGEQGSANSVGDSGAEATARETRPLFLLLARTPGDFGDTGAEDNEDRASAAPQAPVLPNGEQENQARNHSWLARLHLRFLATRIAWLPYYPRWADYLWQRALDQGEAELLLTWSYVAPMLAGSADAPGMLPGTPTAALTRAYLCHPDPLALTAALQQAIRAGVFARPAQRRSTQYEQRPHAPSVAVATQRVSTLPEPVAPAA